MSAPPTREERADALWEAVQAMTPEDHAWLLNYVCGHSPDAIEHGLELKARVEGIRAARRAAAALAGDTASGTPAAAEDDSCGEQEADYDGIIRACGRKALHKGNHRYGPDDDGFAMSWPPAVTGRDVLLSALADYAEAAPQCPAGLLRDGEDWGAACQHDAGHEPPHDGQDGEWTDDHPRHLPDLGARFPDPLHVPPVPLSEGPCMAAGCGHGVPLHSLALSTGDRLHCVTPGCKCNRYLSPRPGGLTDDEWQAEQAAAAPGGAA